MHRIYTLKTFIKNLLVLHQYNRKTYTFLKQHINKEIIILIAS